MSTAPNGWQAPKTDWKGGDVPLPSSFNRIEANAQATELGERTIDPAQAPSGNVGTLRQLLDWFANRVKAITGASNWYNAPATTLSATKSHMDATSGIHGATSAATANRLVIRDAAGRAKFAQGAGTGDAVVYPVPVTSLKRAQGSSSAAIFSVQQYACASPTKSADDQYETCVVIGHTVTATARQWQQAYHNKSGGGWMKAELPGLQTAVTWDYLTASGHPRVWSEVDDRGEILAMWEAEDPADPEFPDEAPFDPGEGRIVVPVEPPDGAILEAVSQRLMRSKMPKGFGRSIYAADTLPRAARAMLSRQLQERGLKEPPDIREALSIQDRDHRHWYLQLYMRQASRLLHDHRSSTLIPLYREMFRADRRTGRMLLK